MINCNKIQNKNNFSLIIIINILILLFGLLFDYLNTFKFISKNLNFDFLNILVNALVIVTMFFVTYNYVNRRTIDMNLEKKNNKASVLYAMLIRTYNNCISTIYIINMQTYFEKYFIPKCDFNSYDDPFVERQISLPFEFDNEIIKLIEDGVVNKDILISYLEIKSLFRTYFNERVIFFDIHKRNDEKSKELKKIVEQKRLELENKINEEIDKINIL